MPPFNLLGHDNENEVQHDFFHHVMLMALAFLSHDVNGIVNNTTVFLRSRLSMLGSI